MKVIDTLAVKLEISQEDLDKILAEVSEERRNIDAETIREQQKLIDEMMVAIKDQNKTLIELLVLTIVAWAYTFFSIAWCV